MMLPPILKNSTIDLAQQAQLFLDYEFTMKLILRSSKVIIPLHHFINAASFCFFFLFVLFSLGFLVHIY